MFLEQTNEYTITADDDQWVLIWHPAGPKYKARRDGSYEALPNGRRSYFTSLSPLVTTVLDRKARGCRDMEDLRDKLDGFHAELRRVCSLERGV